MKEEKELQRDFEELYQTLDKISEEYPEYFKALAALAPTEPPVFIENGTTTTPYGESDFAERE